MIYTNVDEYLKQYENSLAQGQYRGVPDTVATSGAFDIITPGHIKLFETMRKLGLITVVFLNTDESIREYKSPARPVKPWADRAVILDSIRYLDFVIGMEEPDPIPAIQKLKPEIWVKGNRPVGEVVELETVHGYGGMYLSLWTGYEQSSTGYIREAYEVYCVEQDIDLAERKN